MAVEVEIGRRFGRWVVVEKLSYKQKYLARCDCGEERNIRVYDLLQGKTTMCKGCATSAVKSPGKAISNTTEYNTWIHINQRCHNPNNKDYPNYGGRGIEVYPLWRESYEAFYMHMGPKPDKGYSIERLDVNKGYEPGNVVWATCTEQNRNKRTNVKVDLFGNGVLKTVAEWAEEPICTAPIKTVYKRIERGWDHSVAIVTPVGGTQREGAVYHQTLLQERGGLETADGKEQEEEQQR